MTFPVNGRPPPLQYEYQSIILRILWCTSVDVWLPLLFHHRLPVTNWEERDSANFNMYLCPCLSVFAFLCVYLSKYNWIQKKIPDKKRWAAGGPFQFQIWAGVGRWVGFPLPPPTSYFNLKLIEGTHTGHFDFLQEFLRISCIWMNAFVYCRFSSNWILLYFPTVRPCVRHRRDISHFSHI